MTCGFVFQSTVLRLFLKYILLFNSSIGIVSFWLYNYSYINPSRGSSFQIKLQVCNPPLPENLLSSYMSSGKWSIKWRKVKEIPWNSWWVKHQLGWSSGVVLRLHISTQRFKPLHLQRSDLHFRSFFYSLFLRLTLVLWGKFSRDTGFPLM